MKGHVIAGLLIIGVGIAISSALMIVVSMFTS